MKKKIIWTVGIIVVLFAGIMFIGSDESSTSSKPATIVKEEVVKNEEQTVEKKETAKGEETEEQISKSSKEKDSNANTQVNFNYIKVGESYSDDFGLLFTPLEIGMRKPNVGEQEIDYVLYVITEIENTSDKVIDVRQETTLYIDDYQYEVIGVLPMEVDESVETSTLVELNPGRKCKYIFYTSITNVADNADKVEFVVYNLPVLFKDNGKWLYDESTDNTANTTINSSSDKIGNPIIDANPDRYIPEGITGEIDVIDGTFYSNKPVREIIPGEYLIVGGGNGVVTISDDFKFSLKFISNEVDFENADMEEIVNCDKALSYQVYGNESGYVVSFYDGGLYLYTDHLDDENDWAEGFYEIL